MVDKDGNDDPRYEIKNPKIEAMLKDTARILASSCPPGWGFAFQLFEFRGEAFFYISNADRKDMVKALQEFIDREKAH